SRYSHRVSRYSNFVSPDSLLLSRYSSVVSRYSYALSRYSHCSSPHSNPVSRYSCFLSTDSYFLSRYSNSKSTEGPPEGRNHLILVKTGQNRRSSAATAIGYSRERNFIALSMRWAARRKIRRHNPTDHAKPAPGMSQTHWTGACYDSFRHEPIPRYPSRLGFRHEGGWGSITSWAPRSDEEKNMNRLPRMTVMILLLFLAGTATAQVSIKQLSNECSKSMSTPQLVDGKIKIVGEEMDPFCRGYLLGVYDVITAAGEVKN